jgi:hypothetical protein
MRRSHLFFAMAMTIATPAFAQDNVAIEVMVGTVLVQSELGLIAADEFTDLKAGDRIFLKAGSAAILSNIENGCFVSLRAAGEYVVPDLKNCIAGQASVMPSKFEVIPANGYPAGVAAPSAGITPVAVGSAFVVAAASAALYATVIVEDEKPIAVSVP